MDELSRAEETRLTRRGSLLKLGGVLVAAVASGSVRPDTSTGAPEEATAAAGPAGVESGAVTCVLAPEQTEGPYYIPNERVRRNITEGKPGVALTLRLKVVDVSSCKPIKGAAVDIWHCDAAGVYSGEAALETVGQTFLRGIQRTDATGVATFQTIYPGWYPGRTVHIHVKVHLGGNVVHTGQLYFLDTLTDVVYRRAPYAARPGRDTRNPADSVFRNGGKRSLLRLRGKGTGYLGVITMGVHR